MSVQNRLRYPFDGSVVTFVPGGVQSSETLQCLDTMPGNQNVRVFAGCADEILIKLSGSTAISCVEFRGVFVAARVYKVFQIEASYFDEPTTNDEWFSKTGLIDLETADSNFQYQVGLDDTLGVKWLRILFRDSNTYYPLSRLLTDSRWLNIQSGSLYNLRLYGEYIAPKLKCYETDETTLLTGAYPVMGGLSVPNSIANFSATYEFKIKSCDLNDRKYSVSWHEIDYSSNRYLGQCLKLSLDGGVTKSSSVTTATVATGEFSETVTVCLDVPRFMNLANGDTYFCVRITDDTTDLNNTVGLYGHLIFENNVLKSAGIGGWLNASSDVVGTYSLAGSIEMSGIQRFLGPVLTITELFRITCRNGVAARFTPHPESIILGGDGTYQNIPIRRSEINYHPDLQVDKVTVDMGIVGITIGSQQLSIPQLIQREYLSYAHVEILAYDFVKKMVLRTMFEGYITGDVSYSEGTLTFPVTSLLDKLKELVPKIIWSEFCQHHLYSSRCGVSKGAYTESGEVTGGTGRVIQADLFLLTNKEVGWWARGAVTFTSGANQGISRAVYSHGDGYVNLIIPFPEAIVAGDTFTVCAGCDRTGVTCDEKFDNYENFFGFEYIPKSDVLYG